MWPIRQRYVIALGHSLLCTGVITVGQTQEITHRILTASDCYTCHPDASHRLRPRDLHNHRQDPNDSDFSLIIYYLITICLFWKYPVKVKIDVVKNVGFSYSYLSAISDLRKINRTLEKITRHVKFSGANHNERHSYNLTVREDNDSGEDKSRDLPSFTLSNITHPSSLPLSNNCHIHLCSGIQSRTFTARLVHGLQKKSILS